MKKVLITCSIPNIAKEILSERFSVDVIEKTSGISYDELLDKIDRYDAILTMLNNKIDQKLIDRAKKLRVISNYAIGLDNIDTNYAKQKKISVYNLPDIVTDSTADFTFAILLSLIRKVIPANKFVLDDKWNYYDPSLFLGEELNKKTLGIVGMGRVGEAVAKRALGFGLKVIYYNRSKKQLNESYKQVSLDELFEKSDYISLHVALSDKTKHLIAKEEFQKMKKKPVLINMARGSVINTDDLVIALKNKSIRACSLDVTDPEPISKNHPLCLFDNCLILPHIGTATVECRYEMAKTAALNIFNHFQL